MVGTTKGFFIEVFDSNRNKLYEINKKYRKLKVTDEYKDDCLKSKKKSKDFVDDFEKRYYRYVFKNYFPAFKKFMVKDGKIYVFTYKRIDNKSEVLVMELK